MKHNPSSSLPVLDTDMGDRIRHVVGLFDRKKDAAEIAGVIPEQLNRWCLAQSEPRFVGISRMALSQNVCLHWIATGNGTPDQDCNCAPSNGVQPPTPSHRDILMAMISGFLAAEGIENAARIAYDIMEAHDEIISNIEKNQHSTDPGYLLSEAVSTIIARYRNRTTSKPLSGS